MASDDKPYAGVRVRCGVCNAVSETSMKDTPIPHKLGCSDAKPTFHKTRTAVWSGNATPADWDGNVAWEARLGEEVLATYDVARTTPGWIHGRPTPFGYLLWREETRRAARGEGEYGRKGDGMNQGEARRRAKELGGIAVGARRSPTNGHWLIGGWSGQEEAWIVVSLDRSTILDDGLEEELGNGQ